MKQETDMVMSTATYKLLGIIELSINMMGMEKREKITGSDGMINKELEAVIKLPANKRYEYFIKKVVDFEEVWGLYHDGWAISQDDTGKMLMPFWPRKEFAELCSIGEWSDYTPKSIELDEFINDWLPGIKEDGYKLSIFWNNNDSAVLEVDTLLRDLETELYTSKLTF